jgi:cobalt-zinc-cadmium efflux system outer membrane protein
LAIHGFALGLSPTVLAVPLTLKDAVNYALQHSPKYQTAEEQLSIARRNNQSAYYNFFPQAEISSQYGIAKEYGSSKIEGSDSWRSSLTLGLTQNLYNNGQDQTNYEIKKSLEELASLEYEKSKAELSFHVANAFYNHSEAALELNITQEFNKTLEKQVKITESYYRQGLRQKNAYLRIKAQLERSSLDLRSAQDRVSLAKEQLRALLGNPNLETEIAVVTPTTLEREFERSEPIDVNKFYDIVTARLNAQIAENQILLTKQSQGFKVNLVAEAAYGANQYMGTGQRFDDRDRSTLSLMLRLDYPLWDWGASSREIENATSAKQVAENNAREALLNFNKDIAELNTNLSRAIDHYKLNSEILKLEQESFDLLQSDYRLAKISYLDLITGLKDLFSAKSMRNRSYFTVLRERVRYLYYSRGLYEWISQAK